jgi:branched-chain amino acid transport system permease protein
MATAFDILVPGLAAGAIYALIAMGFNVTFATTRVLNFAHGEFLMLGTVIGYFMLAFMGLPIIIALVATVAAVGLIGAVEERLAVRPALKQGHSAHGWLLATFGCAILIRAITDLIMGPDARVYPNVFPEKSVAVFGALIVPHHVILIGVAILIAVVFWAFYERTMLGRALGAVSQDPDAAALRGIPIGLLATLSFVLAGSLAAFAGFLAAPLTGAYPTIGLLFTLKGFIASSIGGIPRILGALIGGFVLGIVETLAIYTIGAGYRNVAIFGLLIFMLAVRPGGFLGSRSVRAV